jgi:hypothetical protein
MVRTVIVALGLMVAGAGDAQACWFGHCPPDHPISRQRMLDHDRGMDERRQMMRDIERTMENARQENYRQEMLRLQVEQRRSVDELRYYQRQREFTRNREVGNGYPAFRPTY